MVGTCQGVFDIVHAYVGEREQFGVKIGSFQAIKHKLANMFVALESARATAYFAAATIAEDDDRRDVAVAMAKASVGDCQKLLAQEGIQCLGGIGYTWEHDMHLFVKRLKTGAALFGTGAEHLEALSHLLGL
jgi:alkylation response protein AidB-like acyl-CoA dehydrogenase